MGFKKLAFFFLLAKMFWMRLPPPHTRFQKRRFVPAQDLVITMGLFLYNSFGMQWSKQKKIQTV